MSCRSSSYHSGATSQRRSRGRNSIIPKSKVVAPKPVNLGSIKRESRSIDSNISAPGVTKIGWTSQSTNSHKTSLNTAVERSSSFTVKEDNPWNSINRNNKITKVEPPGLSIDWADMEDSSSEERLDPLQSTKQKNSVINPISPPDRHPTRRKLYDPHTRTMVSAETEVKPQSHNKSKQQQQQPALTDVHVPIIECSSLELSLEKKEQEIQTKEPITITKERNEDIYDQQQRMKELACVAALKRKQEEEERSLTTKAAAERKLRMLEEKLAQKEAQHLEAVSNQKKEEQGPVLKVKQNKKPQEISTQKRKTTKQQTWKKKSQQGKPIRSAIEPDVITSTTDEENSNRRRQTKLVDDDGDNNSKDRLKSQKLKFVKKNRGGLRKRNKTKFESSKGPHQTDKEIETKVNDFIGRGNEDIVKFTHVASTQTQKKKSSQQFAGNTYLQSGTTSIASKEITKEKQLQHLQSSIFGNRDINTVTIEYKAPDAPWVGKSQRALPLQEIKEAQEITKTLTLVDSTKQIKNPPMNKTRKLPNSRDKTKKMMDSKKKHHKQISADLGGKDAAFYGVKAFITEKKIPHKIDTSAEQFAKTEESTKNLHNQKRVPREQKKVESSKNFRTNKRANRVKYVYVRKVTQPRLAEVTIKEQNKD